MKTFFYGVLIVVIAFFIFCVIVCLGQMIGFGSPFASVKPTQSQVVEEQPTLSLSCASDIYDPVSGVTGLKLMDETHVVVHDFPMLMFDSHLPYMLYPPYKLRMRCVVLRGEGK